MAITPELADAIVTELIDRLRSAERDRDGWREIAKAAIHHAHGQQVVIDRQRRQIARLCEELREQRRPTLERRAA